MKKNQSGDIKLKLDQIERMVRSMMIITYENITRMNMRKSQIAVKTKQNVQIMIPTTLMATKKRFWKK